MKLSVLLTGISEILTKDDKEIFGLKTDSRQVKPGDLFIAYPGGKVDGRKYIENAVNNGAEAVICEEENLNVTLSNFQAPIIKIPYVRDKIGLIASRFFNNPSKEMIVIGITGTNGKTSCSHFLANALEKHNNPCGIIGTLGYGFPGKLLSLSHTTPEAIEIQKYLSELFHDGAKTISMEVSSHGLEQGRVNGIDFSIAVFTNLSRDHLDYHGTMRNYWESKHKLLKWPSLKAAVINVDDRYGYRVAHEIAATVNVIGYSVTDVRIDLPCIRAVNLNLHSSGFHCDVITPWGRGKLSSSLLGRFNVSNILAVLGVLGAMQIPLSSALLYLAEITNVEGRAQLLGGNGKPTVIVDFSHTPDALEKILLVLREHCTGNLWCVFGCGGDRDRGKRPIMAKIAELYSDKVIITDDNPRTESPEQIVYDMQKGLLTPWAVTVEHDRAKAIKYAIKNAKPEDVVLIAGKGHEKYQTIGIEKFPFSDIEQANKILGGK